MENLAEYAEGLLLSGSPEVRGPALARNPVRTAQPAWRWLRPRLAQPVLKRTKRMMMTMAWTGWEP